MQEESSRRQPTLKPKRKPKKAVGSSEDEEEEEEQRGGGGDKKTKNAPSRIRSQSFACLRCRAMNFQCTNLFKYRPGFPCLQCMYSRLVRRGDTNAKMQLAKMEEMVFESQKDLPGNAIYQEKGFEWTRNMSQGPATVEICSIMGPFFQTLVYWEIVAEQRLSMRGKLNLRMELGMASILYFQVLNAYLTGEGLSSFYLPDMEAMSVLDYLAPVPDAQAPVRAKLAALAVSDYDPGRANNLLEYMEMIAGLPRFLYFMERVLGFLAKPLKAANDPSHFLNVLTNLETNQLASGYHRQMTAMIRDDQSLAPLSERMDFAIVEAPVPLNMEWIDQHLVRDYAYLTNQARLWAIREGFPEEEFNRAALFFTRLYKASLFVANRPVESFN